MFEGNMWKFVVYHFQVATHRRIRTNEIVLKVANLMGVDIEDRDISISHRLRNSESYKGKGNKSPPNVVKFVRRISKDKFYKSRRKLNDLST